MSAALRSGRPRLRPGSRIAVVSPASAAKPELVHCGIDALRRFGYEPVLMPHALDRGPLYYAGSAADRVADLHAAFADESIAGILCTRGGWGSAELLPLLDRDLVRANRKVFVGYSDHTSLQTWFWQECGMASFYAPMVAADWAHESGIDEASWRAALESGEEYVLSSNDGMRVLRAGAAEGRLLGGCLAILEAGLGTPWSLRTDEPCILFAEDIGVKPYQWDRMLQHLHFAGLLKRVQGVVLGDMSANVEGADLQVLEGACLHALRHLDGPVAIGLRCGHVSGGNRSLVLGAMAKLECAEAATLTVHGDNHDSHTQEESKGCQSISI